MLLLDSYTGWGWWWGVLLLWRRTNVNMHSYQGNVVGVQQRHTQVCAWCLWVWWQR
jgi:hypothetical protein